MKGANEPSDFSGSSSQHVADYSGSTHSPEGSFTDFFNPRAEIQSSANRLPHWHQDGVWTFVTWRLGDALPKEKLDRWRIERKVWMKRHPKPWSDSTDVDYHKRFSRKIDDWLDEGMGSCLLREPENSRIVADALLYFQGMRYEMASFVVMPNHVHALFRPLANHLLKEIVKSWKGFSAREINRRMNRSGSLWQDEYWDRLIRNERHFYRVSRYIRRNSARARISEGQFIFWSSRSS